MKTGFVSSVCFLLVAAHATHVYALPPRQCFQTSLDQEIYAVYGDEKPPKENSNHNLTPTWIKRAYEHGPAQRTPMTIKVEETNDSSGGLFYLDASQTKTVGGRVGFYWELEAGKVSSTGNSAKLTVPQGSRDTVTLYVIDSICKTTESRIFKVPKK